MGGLGLRSRIFGRLLGYFVEFCGSPSTKEKKPERFRKDEKSLRTTDYADATDVGVGSGRFDFS
jgi:hypothetical protein